VSIEYSGCATQKSIYDPNKYSVCKSGVSQKVNVTWLHKFQYSGGTRPSLDLIQIHLKYLNKLIAYLGHQFDTDTNFAEMHILKMYQVTPALRVSMDRIPIHNLRR
jgi:hypothetical protein